MNAQQSWERYQHYLCTAPSLDMTLDISRMAFADEDLQRLAPAMQAAFGAMDDLEAGGIANPDEGRMVGHYWLRNPALAPSDELRAAITEPLAQLKDFALGGFPVCDIKVTKTGDTLSKIGDPVDYSIKIENIGRGEAGAFLVDIYSRGGGARL